MRTIKLTKGKRTIVDAERFEELNRYKWHLAANAYAASGTFIARIKAEDKYKTLGTFSTPTKARREYPKAARKYHGEFVRK